jgi:hypothetical protein
MESHGMSIDRSFLLSGSPSSSLRESFPRDQIAADLAALATGVATHVALPLKAGDVVRTLSFLSGATAAGTPTNHWAALYDTAGNLLAQSADLLTAAWAADTVKAFTLASLVQVTLSGVYYATCMVKATTPPSLMGKSVNRAAAAGAIVAGQAVLAQTSGSALTGTAPATIATPTTVATLPYVAATY